MLVIEPLNFYSEANWLSIFQGTYNVMPWDDGITPFPETIPYWFNSVTYSIGDYCYIQDSISTGFRLFEAKISNSNKNPISDIVSETYWVEVGTRLWSDVKSYTLDSVVRLDDSNQDSRYTLRYRCIKQPCIGKNPLENQDYWISDGPIERWAMLDGSVNTMTHLTRDIVIGFSLSTSDSVAIFSATCEYIVIRVYQDSTMSSLLYEATKRPKDTSFGEFDCLFKDLPTEDYAYCVVTIKKRISGSIAIVGALVRGYCSDIGLSQYNSSLEIIDYSTKTTDKNGKTYLKKGPFSKKIITKSILDNTDFNRISKTLSYLRSTLVGLFLIDPKTYNYSDSIEDDLDCLSAFGKFNSFSIDVGYINTSACSIEFEGLL